MAGKRPELEVRAVEVFRIQPGDVVAIKVEKFPGQVTLEAWRKVLDECFPDNRVVFMHEGVELSIVRAEEMREGAE